MLDTLNEVQAFDLDIDDLREERAKTPPELIEAREKRAELDAKRAEVQAAYDALAKRVKANELELGTLQERRDDAAAGALKADTSKEAAQYQNQELQFATRLQELEEDTLPLMEQLEELRGRLDELEGAIAELDPEIETMAADEAERVEAIDTKIDAIRHQRDGVADGVQASLLKQYEQVRKARRGLGLVEITAGGQCGGCSMKLPIHVRQKAKRGAGVVRCPSCGRILWNKDD